MTEPRDLMDLSVPDWDLYVSESEDSECGFNLKPKLPYIKGFTFTAISHEPPEPYGTGYDTHPPQRQSSWESMSMTDYCLSESTIKGQPNPEIAQTLTITGIIRVRYDQGAQLLEVNHTMVAKIYDPLYYNEFNDFNRRENVVEKAEGDYSREAVAYEALQKSSAARAVTPTYYGTWTVDIETFVGKLGMQTRQVPLVLIERIEGDCMSYISPLHLRKAVRSLILKKVLVAEAIISQAGVNHRDLNPRNIMITGSNYDSRDLPVREIQVEVKVIDFNIAEVLRHPHYYNKYFDVASIDRWKHQLPSPIVRFHGRLNDFIIPGWCSDGEDADHKWLWKHFHKDPRFAPVDYSKPGRPRHQESTSGSGSGIGVGSSGEQADKTARENCSVYTREKRP